MAKQSTQFPHGSLNVFGRNIPLKSNGGLNMVHLTLEERTIYKKFLVEKKRLYKIPFGFLIYSYF
jgi:hypothetical protein